MTGVRAHSSAEASAWKALRNLREEGVHIRRQHPIGRYKVDFAIARARIAIEIDGPFHNWPEHRQQEESRQTYIEEKGWRILRFPYRTDPERILDAVRAALPRESPTKETHPLPSRGGGRGWGEPHANEAANEPGARGVAQDSTESKGASPRSLAGGESPHPFIPSPQGEGPALTPANVSRRTRDHRVLPPRSRNKLRPVPSTNLKLRLIETIAHTGPITVAHFMAAALYDPEGGYYACAPRIGLDGDFVTAPEMSQMFGEIVGAWCAHEWAALGAPDPVNLIELGPGRGVLAADIRRAARVAPGFASALRSHFVETSASLRARQAEALAPFDDKLRWHDALRDIPPSPALIVANEFLDCLPVRQFVKADGAWRERLIGADRTELTFGLAREPLPSPAIIPAALRDAPDGAIFEHAPGLAAEIDAIAVHLLAYPGRALIIDYGGDGVGDTLQAMYAHEKVDPLAAPGACDLTAHVDFAACARLAEAAGLQAHGPVPQGAWLKTLGVEARADILTRRNGDRAGDIAADLHRLTHDDEMGVLFKVLCLSSPNLPAAAGF